LGWSHEEYLAACLEREVPDADHGGEARVRAARPPARKTLDDFDYEHQRSVRRVLIAHLGTLHFVAAKEKVVFLGPPGTGGIAGIRSRLFLETGRANKAV